MIKQFFILHSYTRIRASQHRVNIRYGNFFKIKLLNFIATIYFHMILENIFHFFGIRKSFREEKNYVETEYVKETNVERLNCFSKVQTIQL